jgi:5-formyltetrahydrofolate cyclo-ligase
MVGYDDNLNRIGYGGGFYDKFLQTRTMFKIGIAYKVQKIQKVNAEKHDIKMDLIITE